MKAVKKQIEIDFYPLEEEYKSKILEWSTKGRPIVIVFENEKIGYAEIRTLEGVMTAQPGDMIIKGVAGEVYPCKKEIFDKIYITNIEEISSNK